MAYIIVAEREDETVWMEQDSILFTVTKARVWASEGWNIVVMDSSGEVLFRTQHETAVVADALPVTNAPTIGASDGECDAESARAP